MTRREKTVMFYFITSSGTSSGLSYTASRGYILVISIKEPSGNLKYQNFNVINEGSPIKIATHNKLFNLTLVIHQTFLVASWFQKYSKPTKAAS